MPRYSDEQYTELMRLCLRASSLGVSFDFVKADLLSLVAAAEQHVNQPVDALVPASASKPVKQRWERILKHLKRAGIFEVGDLIQHTAEELSELRNFGQTSLDEVRAALRRIGLVLKDEPVED